MQLLDRRLAWGAGSVKKNGRFWLILATFLGVREGVFEAFFGEKPDFWLKFLVGFLGIILGILSPFWLFFLRLFLSLRRQG